MSLKADQPEFWLDRWRSGQIGFHQRRADAHLVRYWPALELPQASGVFVPLCGKSLDLLWLRERGHQVIGVEISELAVQSFFEENALPFERRRHGAFDVYASDRLTVYRGDLFDLGPDDLQGATGVHDRAALICWPPEHRARYVGAMTRLTAPGTRTLIVALEYSQPEMRGPPFSVSHADVESLYGPHHEIAALGRQDILQSEPRLRDKGLTRLQQASYRLIRRG